MKKIITILVVIIVGVSAYIMLGKEAPTDTATMPLFLDVKIEEGMVDKIYKYSYESNTYYYLTGFEKVDGVPEVYTDSGTLVECNFQSPMIPVDMRDDTKVNPICAESSYSAGTIIYNREATL